MKQAPTAIFAAIIALTLLSPSQSQGQCRHSARSLEIIRGNTDYQIPIAQNTRYPGNLAAPMRGLCPRNTPLSDAINIQSLCPWEYYEHHDENRYPHNIIYANCTCARCIDNRFRCRPVYHSFPVIRQICVDQEFEFFWDAEQIPVGCTCSHTGNRRKKWFDFFGQE